MIAPEREELFGRNTLALERDDLLPRALERGDDHQVVDDSLMVPHRLDRDPEELATALDVEDRHRLEAEFLQREIGELGRLATPVDRHAPIGGPALLQPAPAGPTHFPTQIH